MARTGITLRITIVFFLVLYLSWLVAYLHVPASIRPDLFFYFVVALGFMLPPLAHLIVAVAVGYFVDTLAGKLWGFHVASYVIIASIMRVSSDHMDIYSPFFHAVLIVAYVTLQQIFIALYAQGLWPEAGIEFFLKAWLAKVLVSTILGIPFIASLVRFMYQERT
ncbi:hypothetical protein [Thermodesulforhabdus norvegica]|uniref:Rod shape-determining protein MreD n=1 Tax=Thermodesulforhabdus norvegica TaxID=39841 RepID=A0A1I4VD43_9BACT|nr:hypothetical protein [Thermodesulforhabdus norvegica]SFM99104.1 rod shape-determining protein MreD [Thermodesulforhabdus norvegica]